VSREEWMMFLAGACVGAAVMLLVSCAVFEMLAVELRATRRLLEDARRLLKGKG